MGEELKLLLEVGENLGDSAVYMLLLMAAKSMFAAFAWIAIVYLVMRTVFRITSNSNEATNAFRQIYYAVLTEVHSGEIHRHELISVIEKINDLKTQAALHNSKEAPQEVKKDIKSKKSKPPINPPKKD